MVARVNYYQNCIYTIMPVFAHHAAGLNEQTTYIRNGGPRASVIVVYDETGMELAHGRSD